MKKLADLNWRLPAVIGAFEALGGWGFKTFFRNILIPVTITGTAFLYYKFKRDSHIILYLLLAIALFLVYALLPLTFFGDSIKSHWFNYIWIYLLGLLRSASLLPLVFLSTYTAASYRKEDRNDKFDKYIQGLIFGSLIVGTLLLFSNIQALSKIFIHPIVETCMGLILGWNAARIIGQEQ